jgi:vanillate O-demethylase monooxygenase subunit
MLELFWHPVCTLAEVEQAAPHPLAVTLLGRRLAVAGLAEARVAVLADRCAHRSTRLSIGWIEGESVRCAYHGWRWAPDGSCLEVPAMPDGPVPPRARVDGYQAKVAYDLVWVRLDDAAGTSIPANPAWADPTMKVLAGAPYTWPVSAPRRVENFVDLAHFAWVHDGTLGRRDAPVPPVPAVSRADSELRFEYEPPAMEPDDKALYGWSRYRMPMPLTVDIEFQQASQARRHLWMSASPIDQASCRCFWFVSRDDDLDGDDAAHMAFQDVVLAEDEPVVCAQDPPEIPLDPLAEVSVRTDRVSIEYRRWLKELVVAAADGPASLRRALDGRRTNPPEEEQPVGVRRIPAPGPQGRASLPR